MRSWALRFILSPIKVPLFRILVCESMAALGWDVVPDVNWMLIVSDGKRGASGDIGREDGEDERGIKPSKSEVKGVSDRHSDGLGNDTNG